MASPLLLHAMLANTAVPIFFPHPLVALLALVPIVGVETAVLKGRLGLNSGDVFTANLVSAILGCVLAFVCIILLGTFEVSLSREGTTLLHLLLMAAFVVLPCFVISVIVEGAYLRSHAEKVEDRVFWPAMIKAHIYSYLVLILLDCVWIVFKIW